MIYDFDGLPARIAESRKKRNMSRQRLGDLVGVTRAAVARWEQPKGKSRAATPELDTIRAIADTLQVNFLWLLTGRHYSPSTEQESGVLIPVYNLQDIEKREKTLFFRRTLQEVDKDSIGFTVDDTDNLDEFLPGDVCVISFAEPAKPNKMVIYKDRAADRNFLRRYRISGYTKAGQPVAELSPLASGYPSFVLDDPKKGTILAVVVEHHRNMRIR